MSFTGKVCGGVVILPPSVILPEGADVTVETVVAAPSGNELTRRLLKISERVEGLPADLAAQHDHYLYGTPKK